MDVIQAACCRGMQCACDMASGQRAWCPPARAPRRVLSLPTRRARAATRQCKVMRCSAGSEPRSTRICRINGISVVRCTRWHAPVAFLAYALIFSESESAALLLIVRQHAACPSSMRWRCSRTWRLASALYEHLRLASRPFVVCDLVVFLNLRLPSDCAMREQ